MCPPTAESEDTAMHDGTVVRRKDLLALPVRKWNEATIYDSVYLVPTGRKHDSGYSLIAIVGVTDGKPVEIAAYCDDICWSLPTEHPYDRIRPGLHMNPLRMDCLYPSGIMHMWGSGEHHFTARFLVGTSLSSTDVTLLIERGTTSPSYGRSSQVNAVGGQPHSRRRSAMTDPMTPTEADVKLARNIVKQIPRGAASLFETEDAIAQAIADTRAETERSAAGRDEWQPIESAEAGRELWLSDGKTVVRKKFLGKAPDRPGYAVEGRFAYIKLTHWMEPEPTPAPPDAKEQG